VDEFTFIGLSLSFLSILLQCHLSMRRRFVIGLILPFLSFIVAFCIYFIWINISINFYSIKGEVLPPLSLADKLLRIAICNILTFIFLIIHFVCRIIRRVSKKYKEPPFYIGDCRICEICGMLEIMFNYDSNECSVMCNECFTEWKHPEDALSNVKGFIQDRKRAETRLATLDEIKKCGWDKYLI